MKRMIPKAIVRLAMLWAFVAGPATVHAQRLDTTDDSKTNTSRTLTAPYVVRKGDTLSEIARKSGGRDTEEEILKRNAIQDPNRIVIGQVLYVQQSNRALDNPTPIDVVCIVESARKTQVSQAATIIVKLALSNSDDVVKNIVLKYYQAGTPTWPGFGLAPAIALECFHSRKWVGLGNGTKLIIDGDGSFLLFPRQIKRMTIEVTLGVREPYLTVEKLRVRVKGHKLFASSWTNEICSEPFTLEGPDGRH